MIVFITKMPVIYSYNLALTDIPIRRIRYVIEMEYKQLG